MKGGLIMRRSPRRAIQRAYSLLEVLVSLAILLAGIVAIVNFFPLSLKANNDAAVLSEAALLAHQKAEEIRRDNSSRHNFIQQVRILRTPTEPIQFPQSPHLAYSFCGVSLIDPEDDPGDPRDDVGVARIIIRYHRSFKSSQNIIYELRFDE